MGWVVSSRPAPPSPDYGVASLVPLTPLIRYGRVPRELFQRIASLAGSPTGARPSGAVPGGWPVGGIGQVGGAAGVAHPHVLQLRPPIGAPDGSGPGTLSRRVV